MRLVTAGLTEQAEAAAEKARHAATGIHDPARKAAALARLAVELAGIGFTERAEQAAIEIEAPPRRPRR